MQDLVFFNFQLIDNSNLQDLSDVQRTQMIQVGKAFYGRELSFEEILDETYEGNLELWQVYEKQDPDQILYDVWVGDVDTAAVFYANTADDTGVGMIQNYFGPINIDSEFTRALAKDLQKAFYLRPKTEYLEEHGAADAYQKAVREIMDKDDEEGK